jgi:hypothetical protein
MLPARTAQTPRPRQNLPYAPVTEGLQKWMFLPENLHFAFCSFHFSIPLGAGFSLAKFNRDCLLSEQKPVFP